jgi:hypothetical protein
MDGNSEIAGEGKGNQSLTTLFVIPLSEILTAKRFRPQPRVASTLGWRVLQSNRNAVPSTDRNPFRVEKRTHNFPGLKQPWALWDETTSR